MQRNKKEVKEKNREYKNQNFIFFPLLSCIIFDLYVYFIYNERVRVEELPLKKYDESDDEKV